MFAQSLWRASSAGLRRTSGGPLRRRPSSWKRKGRGRRPSCTPPGGTVRLTWDTDGAFARVRVVDTGSGIASEDLPHLFDRFYRADRARVRSSGGSGLGLAIVQWIVNAHGGRIGIESRLGSGSTVTVWLPSVDATHPGTVPGGR
ncbi:MAG: hypothetical protein E6H04_13360 [Bacillati bacterium ANGP1]|uniref:histidine kinase n=1 Tax=Candidatus Segetimicrobium genomatis TaxID=2569760 RepID=A0A537J2Z3_9BACT|nr:MAG: hypothetical protein E6H04_13360 [Terrabacteria group bacterium ANGP1]